MKLFAPREFDEAVAHAAAGGVAVHLCERDWGMYAHLLDMDAKRLEETVKHCGAVGRKVWRAGTREQQVLLEGDEAGRAIALCEE